MYKKIIAGVAATAMVFGAFGIAGEGVIGENIAITASAAETIDFDTVGESKLFEIAKTMTADEFVLFLNDNNVVYERNEAQDREGTYYFYFYYSKGKVVRYAEADINEHTCYVVVDGDVYITGYTGEGAKEEFITPASINGKKVIGYGEVVKDGMVNADYKAEYEGGMSNPSLIVKNNLERVYIPRTITDLNDEIWRLEDYTILVNADSYALEYCIEQNLKYEIVPDDYAVQPDIGEEDTTPDDKPTTDVPSDKPSTDDPTDKPSTGDPADKPTTDDPATNKPADDKPATDKPTTEGGNGAENAGDSNNADTNSAGDENPATGAAAIAFAGLTLAGAAIAITKKNK